jgi:hypothetical protein
LKLTDAELALAKAEGVSVYPSPWHSRYPDIAECGWEVLLVRGADIVATGRATTREGALEAARKRLKRC